MRIMGNRSAASPRHPQASTNTVCVMVRAGPDTPALRADPLGSQLLRYPIVCGPGPDPIAGCCCNQRRGGGRHNRLIGNDTPPLALESASSCVADISANTVLPHRVMRTKLVSASFSRSIGSLLMVSVGISSTISNLLCIVFHIGPVLIDGQRFGNAGNVLEPHRHEVPNIDAGVDAVA